MIRALSCTLVALLIAGQPTCAAALTAEELQGTYEAVDGLGNTCADNPARLTVRRAPDHLSFDWPHPMTIYDGSTSTGVTYDLLEERDDVLVLRLEDETRLTDSGAPVIWLLRPDEGRTQFCWGRTDWPPLRCQGAFRRCAEVPPTS